MIYLIGETGASETNDEKYAQALEKYSYYQRCTEEEYRAKLLEIEALDNAEVDQPTYCPPVKLYLQIRDDYGDELDEVTWSDDRVNDTDVEYVLASKFYHVQAERVQWCMEWQTACAKLLHVQAERDTLQALNPLYRAVDRLLWHPLSNSYPKGYHNRDQLTELWETFRGMSVDEEAADDTRLG